jgi:hypothetical protein
MSRRDSVWISGSVTGLSLRCADRDAVGLKPGKDCTADVLGGSLKPCGGGSVNRPRQFSRTEHRQPGIVFGSHRHERNLTDWLSICNNFVLVRTLIRGKEGGAPVASLSREGSRSAGARSTSETIRDQSSSCNTRGYSNDRFHRHRRYSQRRNSCRTAHHGPRS